MTIRRGWLVAGAGLLAGGLAGGGLFGRGTPQPVRFLHDKHPLLQCAVCHPGVRADAPAGGSGHAGLPSLADCLRCHARAPDGAGVDARWWRAAQAGATAYFQSRAPLPIHARFSHRRHVVEGGLDCVSCHGDVREPSAPRAAGRPARLNMAACLDCHRRQQPPVTVDCNACHR